MRKSDTQETDMIFNGDISVAGGIITISDDAATGRIVLDPGTSGTDSDITINDFAGTKQLELSSSGSYRILFSDNSVDKDITMIQVDVSGDPVKGWDEASDSFSQNKGLVITSGDLIIPDDLVHNGDPDTLWSFDTDQITGQAGGITLLQLTEDTQDVVSIGDVAGGGDVDINFNDGQVFLQGSSGQIGIATASPQKLLQVGAGTDSPTQSGDGIYIAVEGSTQLGVRNTSTNVEGGLFCHTDGAVYVGAWTSSILHIRTANTNRIDIDASGGVVVNESGADIDVRFESDNDANNLYLDGGNDAVLIGTSSHSAASKLIISQTHTDHTAGVFCQQISFTANLSSAATAQTYRAMNFQAQIDGSGGNTGDLTGVVGSVRYNQTSGTLGTLQAASFDARVINAGDVTTGYGLRVIPILSSSGDLATWRALEIRSPSISSTGGITTAYGIYLAQQEVSGVTTGWGVYQVNASDDNYFEGAVGVGTNSIAAKLHVDQSSTTAAVPVVVMDQGDVDEPAFKIIGTAASANLTRTIVNNSDVSSSTLVGWYKIELQDDGNQITDQDYYAPAYTLA